MRCRSAMVGHQSEFVKAIVKGLANKKRAMAFLLNMAKKCHVGRGTTRAKPRPTAAIISPGYSDQR